MCISLKQLPNFYKLHIITCTIFLLVLRPTPSYTQYDNVDYEITDYEEEPEFDDGQQSPIQPEATLIPPHGTQQTEDRPTLFKLPENYSVHKSPPLIGQ